MHKKTARQSDNKKEVGKIEDSKDDNKRQNKRNNENTKQKATAKHTIEQLWKKKK